MPPERVKLIISDVDGVLTDGTITVGPKGEEMKLFSIQDGLGVRLLQKNDVGVCFLSSRDSEATRARAQELGVTLQIADIHGKRERLERIAGTFGTAGSQGIDLAEVCYIGDDLVDLPCLRAVGFPVAVLNARDEVKEEAEYITRAAGGRGAFREVTDLILKARGLWQSLLETFR